MRHEIESPSVEAKRVVDAECLQREGGSVRKRQLRRRFKEFGRRGGFVEQVVVVEEDLRFPMSAFIRQRVFGNGAAMFGQADGSVHVGLQCLDEREIVAFFFRRRVVMVGRRIVIDLEISDGEREVERIGRVGGARQFIGGLSTDVGGELRLLAGEQADGRSKQKEGDANMGEQEANAAQ